MHYRLDKVKVRRIMKSRNINTQTELAQKMGITKNQLSNMLSKEYNPVKSNARLLCDVLEVPFEKLICSNGLAKNDISPEQLNLPGISSNGAYVDIASVKPLKQYKVLELFAGAGGLALGLEEAGFKSVGLVEVDRHCCNTLRQNKPQWNVIEEDIVEVVQKGIKNILPQEDWDIDLLSGGYPCQAFSYSGKKLGFDDVRGTMFYYYAAILRELMPKMFLAENVRGLQNHDSGKTLETMLDVFEDAGYNVEYRVLRALDYGVAQKRERLLIIGIRNDIKDVQFKYPEPYDKQLVLRDVLQDVPSSEGAKYPQGKKEVLELVPPGGYWRDLPDDIAKEYMGKSYYSSGGRTGMARRLSWDEPSLTLTCSPAQKQTERCHPDETRPFTVREYARIQSFPDEWEFAGSMHNQYKQIGNAVPVEFARAIGLALINTLNEIT